MPDPQTTADTPPNEPQDQPPAPVTMPDSANPLPTAISELGQIQRQQALATQAGMTAQREGRVNEVARARGLPNTTVRAFPDSELRVVPSQGALLDAPATRAWMNTSLEAATMGGANPDQLATIEAMARAGRAAIAAADKERNDNPAIGLGEAISRGFDQARYDQVSYDALVLKRPDAQAEYQRLTALEPTNEAARQARTNPLMRALNSLGGMVGPLVSNVETGLISAPVGLAGGAAAGSVIPGLGTAAGATLGAESAFTAGMFTDAAKQAAGRAARELSQTKDLNGVPLPPEVWMPAANGIGLIQGALQTIGLRGVGSAGSAVTGSAIQKLVTKAMGDEAVQRSMASIGGKYAGFVGEQFTLGAGQEAADVIGKWAATNAAAVDGAAFTPDEKALLTSGNLGRIIESGATMAGAMGLAGALPFALRLGPAMARARAAEAFAKSQGEINGAVQDSELLKLSPAAAREHLQSIGNGGEVRLDSDHMATVDPAITDKLGLSPYDVKMAEASGQDITRNLDELVTKLNPEEFRAIQPGLKMGSGARSPSELKAWDQVTEMRRASEVMQTVATERQSFTQEMGRIKGEIVKAVNQLPDLRAEIAASGDTVEGYAARHADLIRAASERQAANGAELGAMARKISVQAEHGPVDLAKELGPDVVPSNAATATKGAAGSVTADPGAHVIKLFADNANLSTLAHESAHVFLKEQTAMARAWGPLPDAMGKDWNALTKWLGVDLRTVAIDSPEYSKAHEQFARGFEEYLSEGKAPSADMRNVFERFKAWMARAYKSIKDLGPDRVPLTPEVRNVFDRMLAADQESTVAAADKELLIRTPHDLDGLGLSDDERNGLLGLLVSAQKHVAEALFERREKGRDAREAKWKDEAAAEVLKEPAWQAVSEIRDAGGLNARMVEAQYGENIAQTLRDRGLLTVGDEPGVFAAEVADAHRFTDAPEMFAAIMAEPPTRAETVARKVEEQARAWDAKFGADELMLHTDEYGQYLDQLGGYLARAVGSDMAPIKREAFRALAEQSVGDMALDQACDYKDALEAFKWANAQERRATATGNWPDAYKYHNRARLNWEKARVSEDLANLREKVVRKGNEGANADRGTLDEQYHLNLIRLLSRFGLLKRKITVDLSKAEPLAKLLTDPDGGPSIASQFPDWMLDDSKGMPAAKLTGEQFQDLAKIIQHLNAEGRTLITDEVRSAGMKREALNEALAKPMAGLKDATIHNLDTLTGRALDAADGLISGTDQLRFTARKMDGYENIGAGSEIGPNERYLLHGLSEADHQARAVEMESEAAMAPVWKQYVASSQKHPHQILTTGVPVPERMAKAGKGWTFDRIWGLALLWGNRYNREAVKAGYHLTEEQVTGLIKTLTDDDWKMIQATWDAYEPTFQKAQAVHFRVNHFHQERVQPLGFISPTGRVMRGGYHPLTPDRTMYGEKSPDLTAEERADAVGAMFPPTTKAGAMKARTDFGGRPPLLSATVTVRHFQAMANYIGREEIIREIDRVYVQKFRTKNGTEKANPLNDAIAAKFGRRTADLIRPALRDIAQSNNLQMSWLDRFIQRQGGLASAFILGLNPKVALGNLTSVLPLAREVGIADYFKGAVAYLSPANRRMMYETSNYMGARDTHGLRDRELAAYYQASKPGPKLSWFNQERFVQHSQFLLTLTDKIQNGPAWLGVFQREMAKHGDEKRARIAADEMVASVNPSSRPMDLSAFQRSTNSVARSLLMFSSFRFLYGNRQRYYWNAMRAGKMSLGEFTGQFALESLGPPLAMLAGYQLLWGQNPLAQDNEAGKAAGALVSYQMMGLPLLNELGQAMGSAFAGKPVFDPSKQAQLTGVVEAGSLAHAYVDLLLNMGDPKKEDAAIWATATLASYALGLPVTQVAHRLKVGMKQWDEGGTPANLFIPDPDGAH